MEDVAVEDGEVSGAEEFAPALAVATHSLSVAGQPPARRLDESFPPRESTAEEKDAQAEASSSSSSGKAPMPEAPPEDPAPTPTQAAKKKATLRQSHLDALMTVAGWEPLEPIDEEWLKSMAALIPNGEQFLADRGLTVEKLRELGDMSFVVKAQTDLVAEIQKQQREKGYVEMEIGDDEDQDEGRRAPYRYGRGRKRFRPGVCKKPGGEIRKVFY